MNERLAFLRAIRANPDDDTARLVFADWLDEHDDPLGEFIRVQLELEPIRYRIDNPRAMELHKREDELLRAHRDDWIPTNELLTNPSDFGPVFRRGLPDYACLSLDTFLKNGEAIFAAYPTLREVALYGVANRCWELTMSPLLANLETLEIADWPTEDDAISLGVSPHLPRISRFKLWVGGEPHFLRELTRQANMYWPREIELVQVYGGAACMSQHLARESNEEVDHFGRETNERLRRTAIRVTRPFERQFPLNGELGHNVRAGRLPDGKPALAAGGPQNWILAIFTEDGHVRETLVRESPVRMDPVRMDFDVVRDLQFHNWIDDQLQLEPRLIHVREFAVEDLSLSLYPGYLRGWLEEWFDAVRRPTGGEIRGWLERTDFSIHWGNDFWADWRGVIHSSLA
jgi:uncharacterized protein (TIGR02996 family)